MTRIQIKVPIWVDFILIIPVLIYRRMKYGFSYRKIPLGEGRYTIVEQRDYYWVNNFNWMMKGSGIHSYAVRIYSESKNDIKFISLHRLLMGSPKGKVVDHRNRNRLDNRRANLRIATHSQNQFNKNKTTRKTTSRFIGVSFVKSIGKWKAQIMVNCKTVWDGTFDNEVEAARAYDRAAIKYHGEFARLNFPIEDYMNDINNPAIPDNDVRGQVNCGAIFLFGCQVRLKD